MKKFFRAVRKLLSGMKTQTVDAIHTFRSNPIQNLSCILSSMTCVTSIIGLVAALIFYAVGGGYAAQIEAIRVYGVMSDNIYTAGNVTILTGGILGAIIRICLCIAFVLLLIVFFGKSRLLLRIGGVIMLLIAGGAIALLLWLDAVAHNKIKLEGRQLSFALKLLGDSDDMTRFYFLGFVILAALAVLLLFLALSECRQLTWHTLKAAIFSWAIMPLVLLFAENLIALVGFVLFCALLFAVLYFIFQAFADSNRQPSEPAPKPKAEHKQQPEEPKVKRIELPAGAKLYIDDGQGVGAPMTKCIFANTSVIDHKYICTYQSYRERKTIITVGGKPFFGL